MALIYQVTDTHVPLDPTDEVASKFRRQMEFIAENPADLLVISGDLPADDGNADIYESMKQLLPQGQETVILPGNHDDPVGLYEVFGRSLCRNQNFMHTIPLDDIDLVFMDTSSGTFPSDQLAYLGVSDIRPDSILFTHYPTKRLSDGFMDRTYPLSNIEEADTAIRMSPVSNVFCGHFHCEHTVAHEDGYQLFVTPSAAFEIDLHEPEIQLTAGKIPIRYIEVEATTTRTWVEYL